MGEPGLFGHEPAGHAALDPGPALAAGDRKWPRRILRQRGRDSCGPSRKSKADPPECPLCHGHAMIAALAILKPKLVPGERLVKNDSVNFCLSASSMGLGLATVASQPEGAETN